LNKIPYIKRLYKKLDASKDKAALRLLENLSGNIDYIQLAIIERGKRAVERHWMYRSAGNHQQQRQPKGERYYSFLGLRYNVNHGLLYFRWMRYRFFTKKQQGKMKRQVRGVLIQPTDGQGYDLRKLRQGTAKWERGMVAETERYLKVLREASERVKEARSAMLKLANTLAKLDDADRKHYQTIKQEIEAIGYSREEVEKIESAHLQAMNRAKTEGSDLYPLTDSRIYDPEKGMPRPKDMRFLGLEIQDPADIGMTEQEEDASPHQENETEEAPQVPQPTNTEDRQLEDDDFGLPTPDFLEQLHKRD
jgi:hypothetical protein